MILRRTAVLCVLLASCGDPGQGGAPDGGAPDARVDGEAPMTSLSVDPQDATLDVNYGSTPTLTYHAYGTPVAGGSQVEVPAHFTIDFSQVGSFSGETFTATGKAGGLAIVTATYGGASVKTTLKVVLHDTVVLNGLSGALVGQILGAAADASLSPTIVYPEDGTVIPPNVPNVDWQWTPAAATDVFLAHFVSAAGVLDVLTSNSDLALDFAAWKTAVAVLGAGPVTTTIYASKQLDPSHAGTASETVRLSNKALSGAMYYWSSNGTYAPVQPNEDTTAPRGYFRYDFTAATPATTASLFMGFNRAGSVCVGCHSLSRDGTSFSTSFATDQHWASMSVAAKDNPVVWTSGGPNDTNAVGNFSAYSNDGKYLFVTGGSAIRVYSVSAGDHLVTTFTTPYPATQIATSPIDPKVVMYVEDLTGTGDTHVATGQIVRLDWNGSTLSNRTVWLHDTGASVYYPSVSPDGQWVLYDRTTSGDSLANTLAEIRAWRLDRSGQALVLARANKGASLSNSWPKWAPFQADDGSGALRYFFTFSSIRTYKKQSYPQLWLSTFDPSATSADPSTPGLWLPMQTPTLHNHAAQWTEVFVTPPN